MYQKNYWELKRKRRSPEHKVIEAFVRPKIEFIEKVLGDLSPYNLLDVGCGNGFFTYYFQKKLLATGLDYSKYMLSINPCSIKVQGSALSLPFKDNSYEIVFCSNLLHHLENPLIAVKEMVRVSKLYVILSEPNRKNPLMFIFSLLKKEEKGGLKFNRRYLRQLILEANCKIIGEITLGMILPNKTPIFLLPFLRLINYNNQFAFYNLLIAKV